MQPFKNAFVKQGMKAIKTTLAMLISIMATAQDIQDDVFAEVDSILMAEGYDVSDTAYDNEEYISLYPDIVNIPASMLSASELEIVELVNEARTNPKAFFKKHIMFNKNVAKNEYYRSLMKQMMSMDPLEPLAISEYLNGTAKHHSDDLKTLGGLNHHYYSNGVHVNEYFNVSECLSIGREAAIDAVIQLLVDDGVKSLGHRNVLLSPYNKKIGVSHIKNKNNRDVYALQLKIK